MSTGEGTLAWYAKQAGHYNGSTKEVYSAWDSPWLSQWQRRTSSKSGCGQHAVQMAYWVPSVAWIRAGRGQAVRPPRQLASYRRLCREQQPWHALCGQPTGAAGSELAWVWPAAYAL